MNATRIALVTGATDGIGTATAEELARRGLEVVLHGRSDSRLDSARRAIEAAVPGARLHTVKGDLASLASVREMGAELVARFPKLHVLLWNAGVFANDRTLTPDGLELTFQVNHLSHFLLTSLLDAPLRAAASEDARVVTVSSIAHTRARLDWDDVHLATRFDGYGAYATSKLANVMFANELARRLTGTGIVSHSLHPGVITTKLLREGFGTTGSSVAEGARTSVHVATSDDARRVTGRYFVRSAPAAPNPLASDERACQRLWQLSEELVRARR